MTEEPQEPEEPEQPEDVGPPPRTLEGWRKSTVSGAMVTAMALGFQQVFEPQKREQVTVEQEAPGQPLEPQPVELDFHPSDARATSVVVRRPKPSPEGEPPPS